jgi:hypothetical protein
MDLFSWEEPKYPEVPGFVRGSDTSEAAARSLMPKTLTELQTRILQYISRRTHGATCEEVEIALELTHQTCSARCTELVLKGWAYDTGQRRPTSSGRAARVLKVRQ